MVKYQGKGVYGATAIGKISIFKRQGTKVKRLKIADTHAEISRLRAAKAKAKAQKEAK